MTFERGGFMYALTQARAQPASVRLVDNLRFSMALEPAFAGLGAYIA